MGSEIKGFESLIRKLSLYTFFRTVRRATFGGEKANVKKRGFPNLTSLPFEKKGSWIPSPDS